MRRRFAPLIALVPVALALIAASAAAGAAKFPKAFLWGTAIAGFQTEAGQGRNLDPASDWFAWTHDPANIADGSVSGDLPEDGPGHWRLYRRDLDLAAEDLHNNAFRFSIEWPRIFPRSTEQVEVGARIGRRDLERLDELANKRALRHYRKVLRRRRAARSDAVRHPAPLDAADLAPRPDRHPRRARRRRPRRPAPRPAGGRLARLGDRRRVRQVRRLPGLEAGRARRLLEHAQRAPGPGHQRVRQRSGRLRGLLASGRVQLHRRDRGAGQPRAGEHGRL